jgi:AraC-like DNA-binding protein
MAISVNAWWRFRVNSRLANTGASITAIGGKLGYTEASAFVRAFKRMTGTTPVAYRKKVRQNQAI